MKYFLIVFLVGSLVAKAQEPAKKQNRFFYGVTISPNLTKMQFVDDQLNSAFKNNLKVGIGAGATVKYILSKHFFASGGIGYSIEKSEMTLDNYVSFDFLGPTSAQLINQYNFNWIDIPLSINFIINPKSKTQAFIGGGVVVRKLLSSRINLTSNRMDASTNRTVSATSEISTLDYFNSLNAFGTLTSVVQFLGKNNDVFTLSLSIHRNLFDLVKAKNSDPNALFDYGYQTTQLRLTNFSLNLSYLIH